MKRTVGGGITRAALFLLVAGLVSVAVCISPAELPFYIDNIIAQPQYTGSLWGVVVQQQDSETGEWNTLYSKNAVQFFQAASNNKILTTSAALLYFGLDHTINTTVLSTPITDGFSENVCVIGAGDASIGEAEIEQIASSLAANGIFKIATLTIDDTLFPSFPSTWAWEDITADYGAAPNSIVFNENALLISVSPTTEGNNANVTLIPDVDNGCILQDISVLTVSDDEETDLNAYYSWTSANPATLIINGQIQANSSTVYLATSAMQPTPRFACVLNFYLAKYNISVGATEAGSQCALSQTSTAAEPIGLQLNITSPSFNDTMYYTLQVSDNLYAECFLRILGANTPPLYPGVDAQTNGLNAVRQILSTELSVNASLFHQNDGSGLSRENLISPLSLIETLRGMDSTNYAADYIRFLPVAGESGTLQNRYVNTTAQGVIHAKTGTLTGACALSGFVLRPDYDLNKILFSIIVNDGAVLVSEIEAGIDAIGILLSQLGAKVNQTAVAF